MNTRERRQLIAAVVAEKGHATIAELSDQLSVSAMTVRRDLDALADDGLVRRVRGAAMARISSAYEPPYLSRASKATEAKARIGQAALDLILQGDTIVIDTGTTALELVRAIRGTKVVTVVTASVRIAMELSTEPDIRVVVTGGFMRHGELSLIGSLTEHSFHEFNCESAFIGVGGVHLTKGFTDYNPDDARIKRAAMAVAMHKIVLADATKLDRVAFVNVSDIDAVDTVVTDAPKDDPTVKGLVDAGVTVINA